MPDRVRLEHLCFLRTVMWWRADDCIYIDHCIYISLAHESVKAGQTRRVPRGRYDIYDITILRFYDFTRDTNAVD